MSEPKAWSMKKNINDDKITTKKRIRVEEKNTTCVTKEVMMMDPETGEFVMVNSLIVIKQICVYTYYFHYPYS